MACLDTTILLDLLGRGGSRRRDRAKRKLRELDTPTARLTTTRINVTELYVGVFRSKHPDTERAAVEAAIAPLEVLELDQRAAMLFGRMTAMLQEAGRPCGDMDVMIAAIATAAGEALVTDNRRHFDDLPMLQIESY